MAVPEVILRRVPFEEIAKLCNVASTSNSLIIGNLVYVYTVLKSCENSYKWVPGKITAIISRTLEQAPGRNNMTGEDLMYEIQTMDKDTNCLLYVTAKHLAYPNAPCYELKVTTRVIARNNKLFFKPGTIGEKPTTNNKRRYLVFFDDGSAQYCQHSDLRLVCCEKLTIDVLTPETRFLTKYFATNPVRPVVKVTEKDLLEIQLNGRWQNSVVYAVDSSLVLLYYENENGSKEEWVYRGSPRLAPIHFVMSGEEVVHKKKSDKSLLRSRGFGTALAYKGKPIPIEYLPKDECLEDDFSCDQNNHGHSTQIKSQSDVVDEHVQINPIINQDLEYANNPEDSSKSPSISEVNNMKDHQKSKVHEKLLPGVSYKRSSLSEKKNGKKMRLGSKLSERKLLFKLTPMQFKPHQCSPDCVSWTGCSVEKAYGYDPLVKPLVFGFKRHICFSSTLKGQKGKSVVMYKTPCGRLMSSLKYIVEYLHVTQSSLSCDMFTFHPNINPLTEYTEGYTYFRLEDLSDGQEYVPISVVNEQENTQPDNFNYTTQMQPGESVPLNRDTAFLSSCDCSDDCQDVSKCNCHRMTSEGEFPKLQINVGYKYRRLLYKVQTGIFECNSRCKCSSRCGNRVVQQPLTLRLQLFKTEKKGWGLRCLHDLPKGTFICCYMGEILPENQINKCKYGDKYIAELDFLELSDKHKKGYEKDVYEAVDVRRVCDTNEPDIYLVDARVRGNIGRFFNHSCNPNVFVQNVFVETHDLRFPCLAFFTSHNVRAGTELAWDYGYDIGSADHQIICHCGSKICRGLLL